MPIYTYQCPLCLKNKDEYRSIESRNVLPLCECGASMNKVIVPVNVAPKMEYHCPVTGEMVYSKKRRKEIMARYNLVERG